MATLFEDKRVPNLSTPETQTPKATALHHLEVIIPAEVKPGDPFYIRAPDGLLLRVTSPDVAPGEVIIVQYKAAKNKTKRKKSRDPNAPKRASNAYMIFCKSRRPQLKAEHPELAFGKIGMGP
ncbi:hypothetical protein AAMO2058_000383000 [Amorphochlora amoebiformis]